MYTMHASTLSATINTPHNASPAVPPFPHPPDTPPQTIPEQRIEVRVGGQPAISGTTPALRDVWEETSFALERLQAAEECVDAEQSGLKSRTAPTWVLPYTPAFTPADVMASTDKVRVAIIREEGSNGDREMSAAVHAAGMEPWDITMSDLLAGRQTHTHRHNSLRNNTTNSQSQ